ncbi:hypothetical protein J7E97_26445 [Streptomyces sp. ISL-66]|uniref:hypothetical protein n=1 Tax=Streptomyces sp. ISL-66 TaxID=2819186 RepID=UPI001BEC919F|nr:hypothetical protein [Streptomyces sp. ISL-66]MBT2471304.1 hypothetical protein [Streptomyces sp. ISL-66]
MSEAPPAPLLSAQEIAAIREEIAGAVLGGPEGLAASLEHDPEGFLRLVAAARVGAEESSRLLRQAIQGARAAGHSWDSVGGVLGVSRQAAQQRFAVKSPAPEPAPEPGSATGPADHAPGAPARRTITPVTAFNEMAELDGAARDGWHLVDYGPLFLLVEASDRIWEHRRTFGGQRRRMKAEGWTQVGAWSFPWRYYKRPTDQLA